MTSTDKITSDIVLERMKFGIGMMITQEMFDSMHDMKVSDFVLPQLDSRAYSLVKYVWAEKLQETTQTITQRFTGHYPDGPWQMFKARYARWLIPHFPIVWKEFEQEIKTPVTFTRYATYPKLLLTQPEHGPAIFKENFGPLKEMKDTYYESENPNKESEQSL